MYIALSQQRKSYPIKEQLFEPFKISSELQQVLPLRLATMYYAEQTMMKNIVQALMKEAISEEITMYRQYVNITIPETLLVQHISQH